jgi:hypothetical protein
MGQECAVSNSAAEVYGMSMDRRAQEVSIPSVLIPSI